MTGGISSRTCYAKLNFDFLYVKSLSLRRDTYRVLKHVDMCVRVAGKRRTSDLNVTGLRSPIATRHRLLGYEPADLTVHPPPQNCRG